MKPVHAEGMLQFLFSCTLLRTIDAIHAPKMKPDKMGIRKFYNNNQKCKKSRNGERELREVSRGHNPDGELRTEEKEEWIYRVKDER